MWILEALNKIRFQKPFAVLLLTLGAGFLLLAVPFQLDPLQQPAIYALLALNLVWLFQRPRHTFRAAAAVLLSFGLAFALLGAYPALFAVSFTLVAGKLIFSEYFRWWKCAVSALLFLSTLWIASVWQHLPVPGGLLPWQLLPLIHAAVFSFCSFCSFAVYLLVKDPVVAAVEGYAWEAGTEAHAMARSTRDLYLDVRAQLDDEKQVRELEEFVEKMIHLCHQQMLIALELKQLDRASMNRELLELEEKLKTISDPQAGRQYSQALQNKRKQLEQHETLQIECERLRAQITNTISALENIRFSYSHRKWNDATKGTDTLEFLLEMAKNQAENVYSANQAYGNLKQ
jgi:hypothetical protein